MKYIKVFFEFWRRFIVGDDARIAVTVMWAMLFTKSLVENFINGWMMIPVVVFTLFIYLAYDVIRKTKKTPDTVNIFWMGLVPMIIAITIPTLLFRICVGTTNAQFTFIPISICIIVGTVTLVVLYRLLREFPVLIIFILGCISLGVVTIWQASLNSLSYTIAQDYSTIGNVLSLAIVVIFIIVCFTHLIGRSVTVSTDN